MADVAPGSVEEHIVESQIPDRLISELLNEDPDMLDIVEEFVDGLGPRIDELKSAFAASNWDELATLAHRLKGAGGSYGYPELSEIGADMETSFKAQQAGDMDQWIANLQSLTDAARKGLAEFD